MELKVGDKIIFQRTNGMIYNFFFEIRWTDKTWLWGDNSG